jgi:protease I
MSKRILILFFVFTLALSGCAAKTPNKADLPLHGVKALIVVAPKDFTDSEYEAVRKKLEENGAVVKVVSIQLGEATGENKTKVKIDEVISAVNVGFYESVILIGGSGMAMIMNDDTIINLAKIFYFAGKNVSAISIAPVILSKAGVLSGKKATGWEKTRGDIERAGGIFTGQPVTVDGHIITASSPESASAFADEIANYLANTNK